MKKPIVGITTFCKQEVNNKHYNKVSCGYMKVISEAGGTPILIPLMSELERAKEYIDLIDALVLSGGQDVSPAYYNQPISDQLGEIDPQRDSWELKLFNLAYQQNLPILGICRGMQLINIAQGGTLYQDIIDHHNECLLHLPNGDDECYVHHEVTIEENCNLCSFSCSQQINVNSHHHQAIKKLAPGFKVIAQTEGEIVEAIEAVDKDFVLGVQWHPEDLTDLNPCFNQLFNILIERATKK
jgi:putative glutamine amidotransferase